MWGRRFCRPHIVATSSRSSRRTAHPAGSSLLRRDVRVVEALEVRQWQTRGVAVVATLQGERRSDRRIERNVETLNVVVAKALGKQGALPLTDDQGADRCGVS